jgi:hypothetical protein
VCFEGGLVFVELVEKQASRIRGIFENVKTDGARFLTQGSVSIGPQRVKQYVSVGEFHVELNKNREHDSCLFCSGESAMEAEQFGCGPRPL